MRILFDQGTPVPLRGFLAGHAVATAHELGWSGLGNGDLLRSAEQEGFEVLVTTDRNIRHQQNLAARRIAIVVLPTTSWPLIRSNVAAVVGALERVKPHAYVEVEIPPRPASSETSSQSPQS